MAEGAADFGNELIDLTGLALSDLDDLDERDGSSLAHAVRRILDDKDSAPIAGFQSRI